MNQKLVSDKQKYNAIIVFENGNYILCKSFGAKKIITLELCFTTAMTGYQEAMTDPSYAGQGIVFSFPHIGNIGSNQFDNESDCPYAKAIVLAEKPTLPSNFRSDLGFEEWILKNDVVCVYDVDTRLVVQQIRKGEIKNACFGAFEDGVEINISAMQELAKDYSYSFNSLTKPILESKKRKELMNEICDLSKRSENFSSNEMVKKKVLVFDHGIKLTILECLKEYGFIIEDLFPYTHKEKIDFSKYDCIFFSNGPGDPVEAYNENPDIVHGAFESGLPILGICLGHQIIGFSHPKLKMKAYKMKQGHRGINHPIKNLLTSRVEITSQNHGYALEASEETKKYISHVSLFDGSVAGLFMPEEKIMTTQYHPEASAGTHDSRYIFKNFYNMVCDQKR